MCVEYASRKDADGLVVIVVMVVMVEAIPAQSFRRRDTGCRGGGRRLWMAGAECISEAGLELRILGFELLKEGGGG